jgi:hypothetical protein
MISAKIEFGVHRTMFSYFVVFRPKRRGMTGLVSYYNQGIDHQTWYPGSE